MGILDLIYPKSCLECKKPGCYICESCLNKVRKVKPSEKHICFWKYEGVIRKSVLKLKYNFASDISEELSDLIYSKINKNRFNLFSNCLFTCVPLHKKRQNFRGFNQSEEIASRLAKKINCRFIPDLLIRKKNTKPQSQLSKIQRKENLKDVFVFNKKYKVKNKNTKIVVFDDVWTTGTTVKEVMKVLKKQGCKNLIALTIAK